MSKVRAGRNESLGSALKRFKCQCATGGILKEYRKREHYKEPSVRRREESEEARHRKRKH